MYRKQGGQLSLSSFLSYRPLDKEYVMQTGFSACSIFRGNHVFEAIVFYKHIV